METCNILQTSPSMLWFWDVIFGFNIYRIKNDGQWSKLPNSWIQMIHLKGFQPIFLFAESRHAFSILSNRNGSPSFGVKSQLRSLKYKAKHLCARGQDVCFRLFYVETSKGSFTELTQLYLEGFKSHPENNKPTLSKQQHTSIIYKTLHEQTPWPKGSCDSQRSSFKVLLIDLTFQRGPKTESQSRMTHPNLFRWLLLDFHHGIWSTAHLCFNFYLAM